MLPSESSAPCPWDYKEQAAERATIVATIAAYITRVYEPTTDEDKKSMVIVKGWLAKPDKDKWAWYAAGNLPQKPEPHFQWNFSKWADQLESHWKQIRASGTPEIWLSSLEMLEAITAVGLLGEVDALMRDAAIPHYTALRATYLRHIGQLGVLRRQPASLLTVKEANDYIEMLDNYPRSLTAYQHQRDTWASRPLIDAKDGGQLSYSYNMHLGYDFLVAQEPEFRWRYHMRSLSAVTQSVTSRELGTAQRNVGSALAGTPAYRRQVSVDRWSSEELPLATVQPLHEYIVIHGVEFESMELARIFYNTPLALAVEYGTQEYNPPYLTVEDVTLMQDLLEGRIMAGIFYEEISNGAFNVLLTGRSFLDTYEWPTFRRELNNIFVLGVPFRQQIIQGQFDLDEANSFRDTVLRRLQEFTDMVAAGPIMPQEEGFEGFMRAYLANERAVAKATNNDMPDFQELYVVHNLLELLTLSKLAELEAKDATAAGKFLRETLASDAFVQIISEDPKGDIQDLAVIGDGGIAHIVQTTSIQRNTARTGPIDEIVNYLLAVMEGKQPSGDGELAPQKYGMYAYARKAFSSRVVTDYLSSSRR